MSRFYTYCSLMLLPFLFTFCNSPQEEKLPDYAIVAGKIVGAENTQIGISLADTSITSPINETGDFRIKIPASSAEYFNFSTDNFGFLLFLAPGDSLYFTAEYENFGETFEGSGDRSAEAMYLRKKQLVMNEFGANDTFSFFKQEGADFLATLDSINSGLKALFADVMADEESIHPKFYALESTFLDYFEMSKKTDYPRMHRYFNNLPPDAEIDFPEDEVNEELMTHNFSNPQGLELPEYNMLVQRKNGELASTIYMEDSVLNSSTLGWAKAHFIAADSLFSHQEVRSHLKFTNLQGLIDYQGVTDLGELWDDFVTDGASDENLDILKTSLAAWQALAPGTEVTDFAFVNIEGDTVRLSDLKGQLVYIDVWATWCKPCIAEHPHWDQVKLEFANKEVAFVTISIDQTIDPWIKMVNNKEMEGYQWFTDGAWESTFASFFMVKSIPRFLLIDKEGKILDAMAPRPSGKIREVLNEYLQEETIASI